MLVRRGYPLVECPVDRIRELTSSIPNSQTISERDKEKEENGMFVLFTDDPQ